jgi:hypothetical protein
MSLSVVPQPRGVPRRALLLFPLYLVPDFCVLFRSQGKTAKGALEGASAMIMLGNLSHFECSPVVVKGLRLSDYASTDPSIRINSSSERTLPSAQI